MYHFLVQLCNYIKINYFSVSFTQISFKQFSKIKLPTDIVKRCGN